MPTERCNATINGKPVKVILVDKGWKKMYFAKPKNYDVNTPHFEQRTSGSIEVHEDSSDCARAKRVGLVVVYNRYLFSCVF